MVHGRYSSMSRPNQQDQEDQGAHVEVTIPATNVNETVRSEVESSSNTSSSSSQSERENESRPSGTSILAHELRKLVDTANAPIFGIDAEGNVNEWNFKTAEITGYSLSLIHI